MASFTAHHRTADFRALFQRVLTDMKDFIGTKTMCWCWLVRARA